MICLQDGVNNRTGQTLDLLLELYYQEMAFVIERTNSTLHKTSKIPLFIQLLSVIIVLT
jgi:hypothetical protein